MTTLITLVGEQPIPNLLPARHLKPERVIFVHTGGGSHGTETVARRVASLLSGVECRFLPVSPYDVPAIQNKLEEELSKVDECEFNLTGGTKPMNFAAYRVAQARQAPFFYFQTEGHRGRDLQSLLYRYTWDDLNPILQERTLLPPGLITIDDYLRAHLAGYTSEDPHLTNSSSADGWIFEKAVHEALHNWVDEDMAGVKPEGIAEQVEIDLIVRCGNQVAVLELKSYGGSSGKDAIDQLTTAAAREYLGTYTARFIVVGGRMDQRYKRLAERLRVRVVEFSEYRSGQSVLRSGEVRLLRQSLAEQLPCSRAV